jgi:hypothetical protein
MLEGSVLDRRDMERVTSFFGLIRPSVSLVLCVEVGTLISRRLGENKRRWWRQKTQRGSAISRFLYDAKGPKLCLSDDQINGIYYIRTVGGGSG